jgi:hypothetical protein
MKLGDQEQKLVLLALDPAAQPGEAANAAVAFFRALKRRYRDGHTLLKELVNSSWQPPPPPPRWKTTTVNYGETIMPFGKHRGKELCMIPVDYLLWVLDNCERLDPYLEEAIRRFLRDNEF